MHDPDRTGAYQPDDADPAADLPAHVGRYRVARLLGRGGFGLVYLAHDDQLQRLVAVKVPHPRLVDRPETADAYRTEARTAANLDHPNIVPVHDVGGADGCPFFIVSKYIDGTDLASRLRQSRLSPHDASELVATVAEALHHAHRQGLVHRDVKPGNLLLDRGGKPFVTDFGLALREQDVGTGPRYAGTPAYMSPEQARGEGHRVDGRSDVFSLGVVFYELLVGRQPFRADSQSELMEQVTNHEVRPVRQYDETIPKELDRICLKALAKRASERYSTAKDMADDLRHFLAAAGGQESGDRRQETRSGVQETVGVRAFLTPDPRPLTPAERTPGELTPVPRIVPKGLRSFDAHDADFFLELLPGPRDRDGLPDGLRFWKTRLEEKDADNTFAVGLIYGPSGCGKSSLVKAGLLPRLSADVIAVYVEATAEETEARLLNGLRKRCPALPDAGGLKATLAALRRGQGVPAGKKVVVVLDQFEQWLHAKKDEPNTELVQALRQCDGGRVQCVVMVRDDFWLAVSRFLRELEVRLLEGHNSALADLFDADHARKVLEAFGRAFGKLPERGGDATAEQAEFLTQAVAGLAQDGKVVCVRLALFAEMMKGKAWTPAALRAVGGTEGVGVTFLEETFSAATAPPEHRYHQRAARGVLKALLPDSGTDIKGHMRSHAELLDASGYAGRPKDFDDLLRILDGEIRLITPTDPEGKGEGGGMKEEYETSSDSASVLPPSSSRFYQLTHDYLVRSLREWLTRKQKETRKGRAELLLADRAAVWAARPESRQLPSLVQWAGIRWLTHKASWTPPQRAMMRAATRHHATRFAAGAALWTVIGLGSWAEYGRFQARTLRDRLLESTTADAPGVIRDMAPYRWWVDPLLRDAYAQAERTGDARKQLHAALALLPVDAGRVDGLLDRLLTADPADVVVIRQALAGHAAAVTGRLWDVLANPANDPDRRLRAAGALAAFAPADPRWEAVGRDVAATLVVQKPFAVAPWTDALKGAGRWLVPPLAEFLVDEGRGLAEHGLIASVYGTLAADVPDAVARLEGELTATPPDAKRRASVGVALLVMGKGEKAWRLLAHGPDPTVRSYLIGRLAPGGVDPKALVARLGEEKDVSVRRAVLLGLGEYGPDRVLPAERRNHLPRLRDLYRDDPDAGVHAAAEWVLRQWDAADQVAAADAELMTGKVEAKRGWYLNRQGQTMVVVPPGGFTMGEGKGQRRQSIDRPFALASKEVTLGQFLRFRPRHDYNNWFARTPDCPAVNVFWPHAAAYCNWLSEQEGVPKDQWCYVGPADGLTPAPDALSRTGYRLPTEAEWEYACRAGAGTDYSFGTPVELLGRYGWYDGTALGTSHPVASRRPNDRGLFDLHGNVWEWCHDVFEEPVPGGTPPQRVLRGGAFNNQPSLTRSANRNGFAPETKDDAVGFRPARTIGP